jgi:tetratricopeptide (TPR) repeat protein
LLCTFLLLGAVHVNASETSQLRNELGIIHARSGHLDDALRQFSLMLADDPQSPIALNNAGNVYFLQGNPERAYELYEEAHLQAPEVGGILLNLGILEHLQGDEEASRRHMREGMALVGDLETAYYLLGLSSSNAASRASDEAGLREVEIEALLAEAMAEIPDAEIEEEAEDQEALAQKAELSTRAGATKAAQIGAQVERLFWMTELETP